MSDNDVLDEEETAAELDLVSTDKLAEVIAGLTEIDADASITETKYRIVAEMLAADTEEDLWKELPTWSSKASLGRTFTITGLRGVFKSRYPDPDTGAAGGFLAFAAIDPDTGEAGIFTTSALRIAGKLGWYYQHDKLPVTVIVIERTKTVGGFSILDIDKV